jgi:hypothetical protein
MFYCSGTVVSELGFGMLQFSAAKRKPIERRTDDGTGLLHSFTFFGRTISSRLMKKTTELNKELTFPRAQFEVLYNT